MTLEEARQAAGFASSFTRMEVVMDVPVSRRDRFILLGSEWTDSDRIWRRRAEIRELLRSASREELDLIMEPEERAALALLPERFTVYRGCYPVNRAGLSWSADRSVAATFPWRVRYRRREGQPILRSGTVTRDRVVLKLDRQEQEIIAARVTDIREERCPADPYLPA